VVQNPLIFSIRNLVPLESGCGTHVDVYYAWLHTWLHVVPAAKEHGANGPYVTTSLRTVLWHVSAGMCPLDTPSCHISLEVTTEVWEPGGSDGKHYGRQTMLQQCAVQCQQWALRAAV